MSVYLGHIDDIPPEDGMWYDMRGEDAEPSLFSLTLFVIVVLAIAICVVKR